MVTLPLKLTEMETNESNGANWQTSVTINTPSKVIHCSDGVIEDIEVDNVEELASAPQTHESVVDPVSELNRNSVNHVSMLITYTWPYIEFSSTTIANTDY